MSTPDYSGVGDTHVAHEAEEAAATDAQMRRTSDHAAIADVTATAISDAASPGASYTQAEVVAMRTEIVALNARLALAVAAVNEVLDVLRDAELIPAA
jgi:hypothetical protein